MHSRASAGVIKDINMLGASGNRTSGKASQRLRRATNKFCTDGRIAIGLAPSTCVREIAPAKNRYLACIRVLASLGLVSYVDST